MFFSLKFSIKKRQSKYFCLALKKPLSYLLGGLLPLPPPDGFPVLLGALFGVPLLHIIKVIITSPLNYPLKNKTERGEGIPPNCNKETFPYFFKFC